MMRQGSEWPFYVGLTACFSLLGLAIWSALHYTGLCG